MTTFKDRLAAIEERIEQACRRAGRRREEVRLMAVSKVHPVEAIFEAAEAGVSLFGENRVQEFERKRPELVHLNQIEVHLIGHLQANKSAKAAELFSAIDTLDSLRLAERLNDAAQKLNRSLPVLLEIKLSPEATKTGLDPAGHELDELLDRMPDLSHLYVRGLMTIAPLDENPDSARNCFRQLRRLRDELAARHSRLNLSQLSMGMSGDFEIAIEEGSTMVRIGTALFGKREVRP
ncbi:MAG: YggS family pyridoxal phosphate-dependent enzyme [Silvibacterium sp.]|nr:YggS family pyridoxal phosphate-dependent enzyme [Silvibacterium sp.]MBV8437059.1 YggS family pyridoxal phosphate-dependent enzyme [Silvibacterium sp.]